MSAQRSKFGDALPPRRLETAPKSRRISLKEKAYEEIRDLIVTLKLQPGERLNEQIISERIGIGRTPVRQALQMLDTQGFLRILPRKGVVIGSDSLDDALTVLEARLVVEAELANFAALRANAKVIERLERVLADGRRALAAEDFAEFMHADRNFHEAIAEAAGNPILHEMIHSLHARIARIWHLRNWNLTHLAITQSQHLAVLRAIAARDAQGATAAMQAHIRALWTDLVDASIIQ